MLYLQRVLHTALDATNLCHAAVMRNVGCLAGPRRNRAEAWNDDKRVAVRLACKRFAVRQQTVQPLQILVADRGRGVDKMQESAGDINDGGIDLLKLQQKTFGTEGRQGIGAWQDEHGEKVVDAKSSVNP